MLEKSNLKNTVYYTSNSNFGLNEDEITQLPGVKSIVNRQTAFTQMNGVYVNIVTVDDAFIDTFNLADSGQWLDSSNNETDAVLCGYVFENLDVGDTFTIRPLVGVSEFSKTSSMDLNIIGRKNYPYYSISMGSKSNNLMANDLFSMSGNFIYVKESTEIKKIFPSMQDSKFVLVQLNENITEEEYTEVTNYLARNGGYVQYEDIIENTNEYVKDIKKRKLPIPFFMLTFSTFSFIVLCVLLVTKQMKHYTIYRLCGCSMRKIYRNVFVSIVSMTTFALAINLTVVYFTMNILSGIIITQETIIFTIIYTVLCSLLSIIIPFLLIRKQTLLSMYKKNM